MTKGENVPDFDKEGFLFHFSNSFGENTDYLDKESYKFSCRVMEVYKEKYGIKDDVVGFSGSIESMIFMMAELIEGYNKFSEVRFSDLIPINDFDVKDQSDLNPSES